MLISSKEDFFKLMQEYKLFRLKLQLSKISTNRIIKKSGPGGYRTRSRRRPTRYKKS